MLTGSDESATPFVTRGLRDPHRQRPELQSLFEEPRSVFVKRPFSEYGAQVHERDDKFTQRIFSSHTGQTEADRLVPGVRGSHGSHSVRVLLSGRNLPVQLVPLGIHFLRRLFCACW